MEEKLPLHIFIFIGKFEAYNFICPFSFSVKCKNSSGFIETESDRGPAETLTRAYPLASLDIDLTSRNLQPDPSPGSALIGWVTPVLASDWLITRQYLPDWSPASDTL